ncbi:MAG TPA: alpha/beta hydrolase [Bacteroidia bacterium]|jgi:pimeloyl-ACP methyl ester carboxylesterase|nr:alpha/beta hydrolase [Bacteroidia bacterium]
MKIIIKIILIVLAVGFSSCFRLDANLFNNDKKIKEYKLDNFTGDQDFILDASYHIQDSMIHLFTLNSKMAGESTSKKIYAIYLGDMNRIATDTVIMYCHGNKWHMDFYWQREKLLAHVGGKHHYGILMIDYRGYGLSEGDPSEDGMYADVDAALQWLAFKGLTGQRLIMYGFSLGTAPVCKLTAEPGSLVPAKFILEAPFASAAKMVADASQLSMPASFVTNLKIDNSEEIKKISQPFMWMHGTDDTFLGMTEHGQVVYDNYHGTYKEAHKIAGAGHSTVPIKYGFSNYLADIYTFIKR